MELTSINNENSFDPTPKLESSPVPIFFIPFNNNEHRCSYCGFIYSETPIFRQKYCKNCLFWYIKYAMGNNTHLDIHISTNNNPCNEHKTNRNLDFCARNIQKWCENCSNISYFKQIVTNSLFYHFFADYEKQSKIIKSLKVCTLCGKLINLQILSYKIEMCSDCYLISSGWIVSTLTKSPIPILYLPWWDTCDHCISCVSYLKFISDSQKWCSNCYATYIGCRYCLTTNIIFGITDWSQCRKCKRNSFITIDFTNISSRRNNLNEFLVSTRVNINYYYLIANYVKKFNKNSNTDIYNYMKHINLRNTSLKPKMKWIPYSQITNLTKIAEGGFGIIYKATWLGKTVAIKRFTRNMKYFLNELKSLYQCYNNYSAHIIEYYGFTQDPEMKEFMLIMHYANGGNLHNYLQKNFAKITWKEKLDILRQILNGLGSIHQKHFIHQDFHSGNILLSETYKEEWKIGDLGLSQPTNNISLNNEIYGVIPYIAPEIFKGVAFSKASDIYSMGMVMWELTTGCKPFANIEHDIDLIYKIINGKRPEITSDTPEFFANLMKRCWDSDPLKRPCITEIVKTAKCNIHSNHSNNFKKSIEVINYKIVSYNKCIEQAEAKRLKLIQLKKLGPEFTEKSHSEAIYTSRPLKSLFFRTSSSMITFNIKPDYITKEYEFDINNIQSSYLPNETCTIQNSNISKEYEFDINDIQSSFLSNINSMIQNSSNTQHPNTNILLSPINPSRKRNIKELEIETQDNCK